MDIKKRLPHEVCYDAADEILRQRAEIKRLRAQQKDMQDRFQAALSWMADQDPQLVEAATEKFLNEQLTK